MSDHEDIKLSDKERDFLVKAMICATEVPEVSKIYDTEQNPHFPYPSKRFTKGSC